MLTGLRAMPGPIRLFLAYAFVILAGIGLSLRFVVDEAIAAPVSLTGIVVMVLLAYTIFTTTLVLQRKEASRTLALGLSSLTIPPIPYAIVVGSRSSRSSSRPRGPPHPGLRRPGSRPTSPSPDATRRRRRCAPPCRSRARGRRARYPLHAP
jgi:hypothetical protein